MGKLLCKLGIHRWKWQVMFQVYQCTNCLQTKRAEGEQDNG